MRLPGHLAGLLVAGCAAVPGAQTGGEAPASLAAAEAAFAAQSVREGMKPAFLQWLAPGATLFRGGPVDGIAAISANPDPPIVLDWRPVHVELAASGEIGLSTGPWKAQAKSGGSAPPRYGQFVSIWRRDGQGHWRVHVDLGVGHPEPSLWNAPLALVRAEAPGNGPGEELEKAEQSFAVLARTSGPGSAYAALASDSIRGYREGEPPFLGRKAFLDSQMGATGAVEWRATRAETSLAGDFGFAIGRYGPGGKAAAGHFLRVWRREAAGWRIALDITEPSPEK